MKIGSMKVDISEKDRKTFIQQMTGQKLDGTVDFQFFKGIESNDIFRLNKRAQAREEILEYMLGQIKKEFGVKNNDEALLQWDRYKAKHGIKVNKEGKEELQYIWYGTDEQGKMIPVQIEFGSKGKNT